MATMRANSRLQVGSAAWLREERLSANQMVENEAEEFLFSVRNDVDWLNEHMAEIFSENQVNVADIFKTPGKLRGKTPRTIRKANPLEARVPLSDVFSSTPKGAPSPFKQIHFNQAVPKFKVAEDQPSQPEISASASRAVSSAKVQQKQFPGNTNFLDSGYYGSQAVEPTQSTQATDPFYEATQLNSPLATVATNDQSDVDKAQELEERRSTEGSFQSAKEEQVKHAVSEAPHVSEQPSTSKLDQPVYPLLESPLQSRIPLSASPKKRSPERSPEHGPSPFKDGVDTLPKQQNDIQMDEVQSPQSDASSPIRPIVRKSSLNFASLPAREPLTSKKSIGNRVSRTSHIDATRTSYYGRQTSEKITGQSEDEDDMETDDVNTRDEAARLHNKTSTQRLQDQISMLGKSQTTRPPSKSITANGLPLSQQSQHSQPVASDESTTKATSPSRREKPPPGAFPDDEDDSWIGPQNATSVPRSIFSPRPQMVKSHTTDVMEDIHGKATIGGTNFNLQKRDETERPRSPLREVAVPERSIPGIGHAKSASTSILRSPRKAGEAPDNTGISVSNPNPLITADKSTTPPKSPSRSYRGSPLKAAKDKFSSILKTSRGLFASSAAVSAEAKSNLTPSASRLGLNTNASMASLLESQPLYPELNLVKTISATSKAPDSPTRSIRKTRASTEREERKRADEAKEAKEAQKLNDQLEKARQKVKEDARVFHLEKERVAAMQKEIDARKEQDRIAKDSQVEQPRATRSSPRKTKAQLEAEGIVAAALPLDEPVIKDMEMTDVAESMPPPAAPPTKSQIGRPTAKRPIRPTKEVQGKVKPPTVIRVDTGSQRGHQYHPSTAALSANLHETLSNSQPNTLPHNSQGTLRHKASTSSIQSKASTASFKSGATKALEAAARKKEQDELAAQKKRDAKLEIERQRAAIKEEEKRKEELQRRQEAERQREIQREKEKVAAAADAKKAAARQAMEKRRLEMERAKETRAPPPAIRPQPSAEQLDKALPPIPAAKGSRMNSLVPRNQEDSSRPTAMTHAINKAPPKRPHQQDVEEGYSRPQIQRNGPSYQQNEAQTKRRKTNEVLDDEEDLTENHPKMTAPPIRQSTARPNNVPTKSLFPSGYGSVQPTASNLQRSAVVSQHNAAQAKTAHPLDMTQISKAPIAFAGSSQQAPQPYKTPARPMNAAGKSAAKSAKSSPRVQGGDHIALPEILTDSEDEDEDNKASSNLMPWVHTPELTRQLLEQEYMDPGVIFGPSRPIILEEVFSKNKEKIPKFRARTSSANWDGEDRLTQDEVRKDVEARAKLTRQGYWTYDIGKAA